jgi:hypothetical protein
MNNNSGHEVVCCSKASSSSSSSSLVLLLLFSSNWVVAKSIAETNLTRSVHRNLYCGEFLRVVLL